MLRRVLIAVFVLSPAASWAYDVKPKTPESAFTKKLQPDILGLSSDADATAAKDTLETYFKGRPGVKPQVSQQKFGGTAVTFIESVKFDAPAGAKQSGETIAGGFSSPASANRAYLISRKLVFAADQQPSGADMIKQVMDKYGMPTIIGNQHIHYFYRAGKLVNVKQKYDAASALDALGKPYNGRAAVALNDAKGHGSCVASIKRVESLDTTLAALTDEAKAANCDGAVSVVFTPGAAPDRIGAAHFMLVDFKRIISAATIDKDALSAEQAERLNPARPGSAPKL